MYDQELIIASGQTSYVLYVNVRHTLLAFSFKDSPSRLQLVSLVPTSQPLAIQQQRTAASCNYSNAALSADGNHLLAICGPAQPYLELWTLSPLQPLLTEDILPQENGTATQSLCSLDCSRQLQNEACNAGCSLSFCPVGGLVACSISSTEATVYCFYKVLGRTVTRRAAISVALLKLEELITCHCWAPSGMLLLGTSMGRLLKAEGKLIYNMQRSCVPLVLKSCSQSGFPSMTKALLLFDDQQARPCNAGDVTLMLLAFCFSQQWPCDLAHCLTNVLDCHLRFHSNLALSDGDMFKTDRV